MDILALYKTCGRPVSSQDYACGSTPQSVLGAPSPRARLARTSAAYSYARGYAYALVRIPASLDACYHGVVSERHAVRLEAVAPWARLWPMVHAG